MKQAIILLILLSFAVRSAAQNIEVNGTVTTFGEIPVGNFPVKARKAKSETLTDSLGRFTITCNENDRLIFRHKPFASRRIKVSGNDTLHVDLVFIDGRNNRELVVQRGFMNPQALAYAIEELSDQNSRFSKYANIYELLKGNFHDVVVTDNNQIYIRGQAASFSLDNTALLILDGLEVRDISAVQPIEIKSVKLLKGSEAAFYGSRGANGVIVIDRK
jgi:TonB-dependent SusC/RagA subfamily outer membrane receptor